MVPWLALAATADNLTPALFGLAGVVCGALVTAGTNVWIEHRHEKAEQRLDRDLLASALELLLTDLCHIRELLIHIDESGRWVVPDSARWLTLWDQERRRLASALEPEDYETIADAFLAVRLWDLRGPEQPLDENGHTQVQKWRDAVEEARKRLERRRLRIGGS